VNFVTEIKDRRTPQLPQIGTTAIWLYHKGKTDAFKRVTVIGHREGHAIIEDSEGNSRLANVCNLIKVYD
jgi:hypothetical protein